MPQFFFHVHHGEDVEPDLTGVDLPNAEVAQTAAFGAFHDLHEEMAVEGFTDWTLEVADETGEVILRLSASDLPPLALPIT